MQLGALSSMVAQRGLSWSSFVEVYEQMDKPNGKTSME